MTYHNAGALRTLRLGLAVAILGLVTASCASQSGDSASSTPAPSAPVSSTSVESSAASIKPGGELTFARASDFRDFSGNDVQSNFVWHQITETLFRNSADGQSVEPWLATEYERSVDGLTWTIKLKTDVTFSNGQPMTSKDVKFSIENAMKSNDWGFILSAVDSVVAPAPDTVEITTKFSWAPLLSDLSLFATAIIPDGFAGKTFEQFYKAPIGTGPFVWDYWKQGSELHLKRNPTYWQTGLPYVDGVKFVVVPDDNTRLLQVQGGQADIIDNPNASNVDSLPSGLKLESSSAFALDYLSMNNTRAPLNDENFRRAVDLAINRDAIVKAALFGHGTPANSIIMSNMVFYDPATPGGVYDPAAAKAALALAKVPEGFELELLYVPSSAYQSTTAQLIQQNLNDVGIKTKLVGVEQNALYELWFAQDFSTVLLQWANDISDPDEWLQFALNPEQGYKSAFTGYDNPEVAQAVIDGARALDEAERAAFYQTAQTVPAQQSNVALLDYPESLYALRDDVEGFVPYATAEYHLENVWLDR